MFVTPFFPVCSSNGVSFLSRPNIAKSLENPYYLVKSPPSVNCLWSLKRPSTSYAVRLTFSSFFYLGSRSCSNDYVEIRDGDKFSTSTFIGKFCGRRNPPVIVSRYTYIFVNFKFISDSDQGISSSYFKASFKAIWSGEFTATNEKINVTNCNVSRMIRRCSQQ